MSQDETVLQGGWGKDYAPVKVDGTIRKRPTDNSPYLQEVLTFLEKVGFDWAPRFLGYDDQGREILTYIDGYVPHGQEIPQSTWSLTTQTEIFCKIRMLHDVTAGTPVARGNECVCHGDLSYANTAYRDGKGVGFIDWDDVHPGRRVDDVAHALLEFLSLGEYIEPTGVENQAAFAEKLVSAYGLDKDDRKILVETMLAQLQEKREQQLAAIRAGTPAGKRIAEAKIPELMQRRFDWLIKNREPFEEVFIA